MSTETRGDKSPNETDTVELGEWYRLRTYGDSKVLDIFRSITAASADGVTEEKVLVEFQSDVAYNGHSRFLEVSEFLDEVMDP